MLKCVKSKSCSGHHVSCQLNAKLCQISQTVFLCPQISEGLSFLHSGVKMVHGNLCPENIILNKSGSWKIMGFDFSISSTNSSDAEVCWRELCSIKLSQAGHATLKILIKIMSSKYNHILTFSYCLLFFSPSTHVKSGSPTSLHSASLTQSTWPLNTSCPSAVTLPLTCTH